MSCRRRAACATPRWSAPTSPGRAWRCGTSRPSPRRMATRMATRRPMRARRAAVPRRPAGSGRSASPTPMRAGRPAAGPAASSRAEQAARRGGRPRRGHPRRGGRHRRGRRGAGRPRAPRRGRRTHRRADRHRHGKRRPRPRQGLRGPGGARAHRRRPPEGRTDPLEGPAPALRCDAKHDRLKGPRGRTSQPDQTKASHGRSFASKARAKARDCKGCDLAALCPSPSRALEAVVVAHDHPAPPRARRRRDRRRRARRRRARRRRDRRRRERRGEDDDRLHRRHRWRSEGLPRRGQDPGRGLSRAARRALDTMRIQAARAAAAINLERLAAALLALTCALLGLQSGPTRARVANRAPSAHDRVKITFARDATIARRRRSLLQRRPSRPSPRRADRPRGPLAGRHHRQAEPRHEARAETSASGITPSACP